MIKVVKLKASIPPGFVKAAARELRKNRLLLKSGTKLKFGAYLDPIAKIQLNEIFSRKCAFCESVIAGTQPGDVEHYRPKGKVILDGAVGPVQPSKPGYHWLAAKWSNLLISCADCNRPRTQPDHDHVNRVIGKANFFPLRKEASRAKGPASLWLEEPLLLNPCIDDPDEHLVFLDDGRIEPAKVGDDLSEKGRATIRYCGLARSELLQMRARHRRVVMAAIRHIVAAIECDNDPGADLDDLLSMLSPSEPYVAFTRSLVREHLMDYLGSLKLDAL
ncbi:hypothetical protein HGO40_07250 [Pseudomonas sp. CG7]|uniref:hypothetical protein n=1 Tax=Pseudomonas sp. CG7 TaxID=191007 RepID=UPI002033AE63|nr:hypothetical protein [Pseudomonas sp. CG7]MCM2460292.1 hypothetical protein [Pseudomonas sp. CG7]